MTYKYLWLSVFNYSERLFVNLKDVANIISENDLSPFMVVCQGEAQD